MVKKIFRVLDMHCSACAMRLEGIEEDLAGIKQVRASYHKMQMEVEYDENRLTEAQILAEVKRLGYQAVAG
jgi:copper chaperone CopZ